MNSARLSTDRVGESDEGIGSGCATSITRVRTRQWRILSASVALISAIVLTAISLRPNFRASFGPVDDHEPLRWLGASERLPLSDYLSTLFTATEIGSFGDTTRFRPAYYAIRVGGAVLLGDSPTAWYGFGAVAFIVTISLLGYVASLWLSAALAPKSTLASRWFVAVFAAFATILYGTTPAWSGIITRLGPSELWALLGTALTALALTQLAQRGSSQWWWLALSGTSLAVLSKENFVPVAFASLTVGVYRSVHFRLGRQEVFFGLNGLLPVSLLAFGVVPGILASRSDVYGQGIGSGRLVDAFASLSTTYFLYWAPAMFVLVFAAVTLFIATNAEGRATALLVASLIAIAVAWLMFDSYTYGGTYTLPRYWVVFETLKIGALLASFTIAMAALVRSAKRLRMVGYVAGTVSLIALANAAINVPQFTRNMYGEASVNAAATNRYQEELAAALSVLADQEEPEVLLVVTSDVDYEPVFALSTQITRFLPQAEVFAIVPDSFLAPAAQALSENGASQVNLSPIGNIQQSNVDLCIYINGNQVSVPQCGNTATADISARAM